MKKKIFAVAAVIALCMLIGGVYTVTMTASVTQSMMNVATNSIAEINVAMVHSPPMSAFEGSTNIQVTDLTASVTHKRITDAMVNSLPVNNSFAEEIALEDAMTQGTLTANVTQSMMNVDNSPDQWITDGANRFSPPVMMSWFVTREQLS